MRTLLAVTLLMTGTFQAVPPSQLHRGPAYQTRPATLVEPARGLPLEFLTATFTPSSGVLATEVRSRSIRAIPVDGIVLRVAIGPTPAGMLSFRMRARDDRDRLPAPPPRIGPGTTVHALEFEVAPEDPRPGLAAHTPESRIVFTVEKLDDADGHLIFENPRAIELLWQALGKPTLSNP